MQKVLGLAVVLAVVAVGFVRADTTFTAANGSNCKDASKPEFGLWDCPGPRGYVARFADEGNLVSVTFAPAGDGERNAYGPNNCGPLRFHQNPLSGSSSNRSKA
jgi:hypothetical protein